MDEWELALCEKIFSVVKEKKILPDVILKQYVLPKEDWNDAQKIKAYDRLLEILHRQNIVDKVLTSRGYNNSYAIHAGSNTLLFDKYQEYLDNIKKQIDSVNQKEAQETEKRKLEIENLKLQIAHQKQWFWKALAAAILVELIQFYFIFIKG